MSTLNRYDVTRLNANVDDEAAESYVQALQEGVSLNVL
jgi:hypothetical protein